MSREDYLTTKFGSPERYRAMGDAFPPRQPPRD